MPFIMVEIIPKTLYNIINWNGREVISITLKQKIMVACDHAGISMTELGKRLGMSQANFSKRVKTGKFTQEELEEMGKALGAEYKSGFYFPDGINID